MLDPNPNPRLSLPLRSLFPPLGGSRPVVDDAPRPDLVGADVCPEKLSVVPALNTSSAVVTGTPPPVKACVPMTTMPAQPLGRATMTLSVPVASTAFTKCEEVTFGKPAKSSDHVHSTKCSSLEFEIPSTLGE